jgi:hypothetical protein
MSESASFCRILQHPAAMAKRKKKKPRLSAPVTPEQKAALKEMAARSEVSLARVVQEAIKEFIGRHPDHEMPLFDRHL